MEEEEEVYWSHIAKTDWMKKGITIQSPFMIGPPTELEAFAMITENFTSKNDIEKIICNYFENIFSSSRPFDEDIDAVIEKSNK